MFRRFLLYIPLLALFLPACRTLDLSRSSVDADACDQRGVVRDFSDQGGGCHLLIVTDAGRKLLPVSIRPVTFELAAGQRVAFSYVSAGEVNTSCLAEDDKVAITCIRVIAADAGIPDPQPCREWDAPGGWLRERIADRGAHTVTRYPYRTDGWAYWLQGDAVSYLYDCQGTLLCDSEREADCLRYVEDRGAGQRIFPAD